MKVEPAVIDNRIDNSSNRSVGLQCSFRLDVYKRQHISPADTYITFKYQDRVIAELFLGLGSQRLDLCLLYTSKESLWTQSQRIRAEILFKEYPAITKGYYLSMRLGLI